MLKKVGFKKNSVVGKVKENYNITKLPSGLNLASTELKNTELAAVNVLVKVGSRYETPKQNGISHLLEHMSFKGTKTRSAKQIAEEFEYIGAYFNAYTSREHTLYYAVAVKEHLEKITDLLSDIIINSSYDETELLKEKEVVLQEIAQTNDSPEELVYDHMIAKAFSGQPMGASILGSEENVKNFSRQDILNYVEQHYNAKKTIVSVAGNFSHDVCLELFENKFANISQKSESETCIKANYTPGLVLKEKDLEQVHVSICFPGPSFSDSSLYAGNLFSSILGDGMSSRLFQEVREKRGLVYHINSYLSPFTDMGLFGIILSATPENTSEVLKVTADVLHSMVEEISDYEFDKVKNRLKSSIIMSRESTSQRSSELANDLAIYGRYIEPDEIIRKVDSLTIEDIKTFAKNLLSHKPTIAGLGKIIDGKSFDSFLK